MNLGNVGIKEKTYVKCRFQRGIFSDEYYLELRDTYGSLHRDFTHRDNIFSVRKPSENEIVDGYLSCFILERDCNTFLISPQTETMRSLWIEGKNLTSFLVV